MAELIDREVIPRIMERMDSPDILLLIGARQVGKTSAMRLIINRLRERVDSQSTHFFDLEDFRILDLVNKNCKPLYAFVITREFIGSKKYDGALVYFIPCWLVG